MEKNEKLSLAWKKIGHYCVYQERSDKETRKKLETYTLLPNQIESLIKRLHSEGYLDTLRFAQSYARGKFTIKKWGRLKIRRNLYAHDLDEQVICEGLKEIENETYYFTLKKIISTKYSLLTASHEEIKKNKMACYAIAKGYEPHLVHQAIDDLLQQK